MKTLAIVGGALLLLVLIVVISAVGSYNRLVRLSQGTDQSWAQVQNVYQRRADLIPNLVATVQGAANFEKSTLEEITRARASVGQVQVNPGTAPTDPNQLQQFEQAQGQLGGALSRLLVVSERYPELRSNASFLSLQAQLEGSENRISVERGRFNEAVQGYNTAIKSFPAVLYAGAFGFPPRPYFTAAPQAQTPPGVQFDFGKQRGAPAAQPAAPSVDFPATAPAPAGAK